MCCLYSTNTVLVPSLTISEQFTDYEIENWEIVMRQDGQQSSVPVSRSSHCVSGSVWEHCSPRKPTAPTYLSALK